MAAERVGNLQGACPARVPGVRRVAVLRCGGLGDLVTAEPALAALRAAYPAAEVTVLGSEQHRALVECRPGPWDRFVPVPPSPGVRSGADGPDAPADVLAAFCAAQRAYGYDLAVQLHGGGRNSNRLLLRLGARVTVGAATPDAPRLDRVLPWSDYQSEVLRWLEVAELAGAPLVRLEPRLAVTAADGDAAAAALPQGLDLAAAVAVHPGATDPRRQWPAERFAAVADALAARGATVLLLAAGADAGTATEVAARMRTEAVVLPAVPIGGLLAILAGSAMMLGTDSGPRHLAEAVGTPTVSVFPQLTLPGFGPLRRRWHRVAAPWPGSGPDPASVAAVPLEAVTGLAVGLWDELRERSR